MSSSLTATGLLRSQNSIDLRQPTTDKCINDKVVVLAIQWRLSKLGKGFSDQAFDGTDAYLWLIKSGQKWTTFKVINDGLHD